MKVVARPIDMVAWFTEDGIPHPMRFRISKEDSSFTVIKIDKILYTEKEKLAGNHMFVFRCQSTIKGIQRTFEVKYELGSCKWILFKI
jgi:hypothetical protein